MELNLSAASPGGWGWGVPYHVLLTSTAVEDAADKGLKFYAFNAKEKKMKKKENKKLRFNYRNSKARAMVLMGVQG